MRVAERAFTYLALWLGSWLFAVPFLWMLFTSLRQIDVDPEAPAQLWPGAWTLQNYVSL